MAAVVEQATVDKVVLGALPARGLYGADLTPLLGGHEVAAKACGRRTASSQRVKRGVLLEGFGLPGEFVKIWGAKIGVLDARGESRRWQR